MTARLSLLAAAITSATMAFATSAFAKTTLTVYTALEADQVKAYQDAFEKANPDIEIKWVRDSTGVVTAKLLAEKNNPRADVVGEESPMFLLPFSSCCLLLVAIADYE